MKINIAIDGPGAAGKSTISKLLAKKMNYTHLDTGAMYRCCSYEAFIKGIDMDDEKALEDMMDHIDITFDNAEHVFINGKDVTKEIRSNDNSMRASLISQKKIVRKKLVELQQKIAENKGFILDGRDIGTVVLPNAEVKIYLIASVESRAKRRYDEYLSKGIDADFQSIYDDLVQRDHQDSTRKESPLRKADDAIEVDTSNMTVDEVSEYIENIIEKSLESR